MTEKNEAVTTVKSDLDISIEDVNHAVAEITKMDAVIGELEQQYAKTIFPVDTPKGMKAAREARAEIRKPRHLIEKLRKAGKAPVLELGRKLDGKAKEQTERLLAIEGPIDERIKDEEQREEREREAKIEAETKRVEAIMARIEDIRNAAEPIAWDSSAADINAVLERLSDIPIDASFDEFQQQANDAKGATIAKLHDMLRSAEDREAEEARIAKEREELEQLRARQQRQDAIRTRIAEIREQASFFGEPGSALVANRMREVEALEIDASFEEFEQEAQEAKRSTLDRLLELHVAAIEREQAEAKRRAELEERERKVEEENDRIAKERIEQARRQEIVNQINIVQSLPSKGYEMTAAELSRLLARAEAFEIPETDEANSDLKQSAEAAKAEAIGTIKGMLKGRKQYEEQQAEQERQRKEQEQAEAADAERQRKAEEAAKKARYPGDGAMEIAITDRYEVTHEVARKWLRQYGKKAKAA